MRLRHGSKKNSLIQGTAGKGEFKICKDGYYGYGRVLRRAEDTAGDFVLLVFIMSAVAGMVSE